MPQKKHKETGIIPVPLENLPTPSQVQDRLVIQLSVSHQQYGEQPTGVSFPFSRMLQTKEQAYGPRHIVVPSPDWMELDTAWVKEPGYVLVYNKTGVVNFNHPDPSVPNTAVVDVYCGQAKPQNDYDGWQVHPGGVFFGEVRRGSKIWLRSEAKAQVTVFVSPR